MGSPGRGSCHLLPAGPPWLPRQPPLLQRAAGSLAHLFPWGHSPFTHGCMPCSCSLLPCFQKSLSTEVKATSFPGLWRPSCPTDLEPVPHYFPVTIVPRTCTLHGPAFQADPRTAAKQSSLRRWHHRWWWSWAGRSRKPSEASYSLFGIGLMSREAQG